MGSNPAIHSASLSVSTLWYSVPLESLLWCTQAANVIDAPQKEPQSPGALLTTKVRSYRHSRMYKPDARCGSSCAPRSSLVKYDPGLTALFTLCHVHTVKSRSSQPFTCLMYTSEVDITGRLPMATNLFVSAVQAKGAPGAYTVTCALRHDIKMHT